MIEKYVKELLFTNDLVAIPGFGCFLCTYAEANINLTSNKLSPPSKKIAFTEKIHSGDSENLVKYISENQKITMEESKSLLFRFAGEIKYKINTEKQYLIDELGRFYTTKDGLLAFEQFTRFNYNEDSFGLPELYVRPIDYNVYVEPSLKLINTSNISTYMNEEMNKEEINDEDLEYIESIEKEKANLTWYYLAAVLSLFFVLGTAYYLNMDKETYAIGSFNPLSFLQDGNSETFTNSDSDISKNKLLPENSASETVINEDESTLIPEENSSVADKFESQKEPNDAIPQSVENSESATIDLSNAISSKTGRYYIIVGSFKKAIKAQKLITQLSSNGLEGKMLTQDGKSETIRVSASDFATYEEASAKKSDITTQLGTEAWILNY